MRKVEEELDERPGIIIGGRAVWNLRYANDTALIAKNKMELEQMTEAFARHSAEIGLSNNSSKTVAMVWKDGSPDRPGLGGEEFDVLERFRYLGSMVTADGRSEQDIRKRLAMARSVVGRLTNVWKNNKVGRGLKVKLMKTLAWTVATYGPES